MKKKFYLNVFLSPLHVFLLELAFRKKQVLSFKDPHRVSGVFGSGEYNLSRMQPVLILFFYGICSMAGWFL